MADRYVCASVETAPDRFAGFILDGSWFLDGLTGPITLGSTPGRFDDGVWPDAIPMVCGPAAPPRYECA